MENKKLYESPALNYGYKDLAPYISEEQLKIHFEKHHQAYIKGANALLEKLVVARKDQVDLDMKALLKELSFNIGGHLLHSLFWENLIPPGQFENPKGAVKKAIDDEFGSFERFKKEFSQAALSVEGSGWAGLTFCKLTQRPIIVQIEKHNTNIYPMFRIILILDVFEHAYYLDYKNDRAKFVEAFWNIINWSKVDRRLEEAMR